MIRSAQVGAALLITFPASANTVLVTGADTPAVCDVLAVPTTPVEELGNVPPFPIDEQISSRTTTTSLTACSSGTTDGLTANALVSITNLNSIAFSDLWYVADYTTGITNLDGTVLSVPSFKIDSTGLNAPLIASPATADGIFDPGETWTFIIQDFVNSLAVSAALLGTEGLPSAGLGSSGSIIAVPVPEPASAALLGLGLPGLSLVRRRAH